MEDRDPLVSPGQALVLLHERGLHIDAATLRRYATAGRIASEPLPSGVRRYRTSAVLALLAGHQPTDPDPEPAAAA